VKTWTLRRLLVRGDDIYWPILKKGAEVRKPVIGASVTYANVPYLISWVNETTGEVGLIATNRS
jgi:hypothetical protein